VSEDFAFMVIYLGLDYVFMSTAEWNASICSQICINVVVVSTLIFVFNLEFSDSTDQKTLFL